MFALSLRQDHFSSERKKILRLTAPFLNFKNSDTFTQILQKQPYQTPAVARFTDTYALTSINYFSTEPKTRSFQ